MATWRGIVEDAERHGEVLDAFDAAERGLAEHPDDIWLKHHAVLALARAGSTQEAARRFAQFGLDAVQEEDVAALKARIAKDMALAAMGGARERRAAEAAGLYEAIFRRVSGSYPGINAATSWLLAGDLPRARAVAAEVLDVTAADRISYYGAATEAEALLLLGHADAAGVALRRAAALHGGDFGAVASTRRQLRVVCELTATDTAVLDDLPGPCVAHFCGHRVGEPRFAPGVENAIAEEIGTALDAAPPTSAYGALASGADILWAEALLARGVDLHVVLPLAAERFVESSVAPAGASWVTRFHAALAAASSVTYATRDAQVADDVLYRYGAELAMGLALLRVQYLDGVARQFAVWDGQAAAGDAGTAIDIAEWRRGGRETTVVALAPTAGDTRTSGEDASGHTVRATLFADFSGYSKLNEAQLVRFGDTVLVALAAALEEHRAAIVYRNTWGDGVFLVLKDAGSAAACALAMQAKMAELDRAELGLPPALAIRIAGHVGPVFHAHDPIRDVPTVLGSHVNLTARIEPVTPPGSIFVTEPFAAALALAGESARCDYVGHMPSAKNFGRLRMYHLR